MTAALDELDKLAKEEIWKIARQYGRDIYLEVRSRAPSASGQLRRSITMRESRNPDAPAVGVKSSKNWWVYAEWGSGPIGAATAIKPPFWLMRKPYMNKMPKWGVGSKLAAWAKRKGLIPFLVAKGLLARGGYVARRRHWIPVLESRHDEVMAAIKGAIARSVERAAQAGRRASKSTTTVAGKP